MSHCARCAALGPTCCYVSSIYVTIGDIERIAEYTRDPVGWEWAPSNYCIDDYDDDPAWRKTFNEKGEQRILLGSPPCPYLRRDGCSLPMDVRPLVCRLYPLGYTSEGFTGLDDSCGFCAEVAEEVAVDRAVVEAWRKALYEEIQLPKEC